jgi:urate oxidase
VIVLGENQYGKAETRLVRVVRDTARHEIRDLTVTTALRGRFDDAHVHGDQSAVLPTDSQKNTVYAFAKEHGVGAVEDFALRLARHFADDIEPVTSARVVVEEHAWERAVADGAAHDHTFVRRGQETRSAVVTVEAGAAFVVSGLRDLVLLKSTGSEFAGFLADRYTTLAPTKDRVMATSLTARWRYEAGTATGPTATGPAWDAAYAEIRALLVSRFATVHSLALQQTLWEMGRAVLEARDDVAEIRLSAPNRHHFPVDLSPFGLDNPGEVFFAADRPYGLIEAAVQRDDGSEARPAWRGLPGFV